MWALKNFIFPQERDHLHTKVKVLLTPYQNTTQIFLCLRLNSDKENGHFLHSGNGWTSGSPSLISCAGHRRPLSPLLPKPLLSRGWVLPVLVNSTVSSRSQPWAGSGCCPWPQFPSQYAVWPEPPKGQEKIWGSSKCIAESLGQKP